MENKTVNELRIIAKENGIKGYSKMRKEELIFSINFELNKVENFLDGEEEALNQILRDREIEKEQDKNLIKEIPAEIKEILLDTRKNFSRIDIKSETIKNIMEDIKKRLNFKKENNDCNLDNEIEEIIIINNFKVFSEYGFITIDYADKNYGHFTLTNFMNKEDNYYITNMGTKGIGYSKYVNDINLFIEKTMFNLNDNIKYILNLLIEEFNYIVPKEWAKTTDRNYKF